MTNKVLLGARLRNGERIIGQNNISHPSSGTQVHKDSQVSLASPIATVFYMTEECQLVYHSATDTVLNALTSSEVIVYAIGSLYTSIMPCLVLRGTLSLCKNSLIFFLHAPPINLPLAGVGERIAAHTGRKVLLLNAKPDRETTGLTASAFVTAITDGLNRAHSPYSLHNTVRHYVTDVVAVEGSLVPLDEAALAQQGVTVHTLSGEQDKAQECAVFKKAALAELMLSLRLRKIEPRA